MVPSYRHSVSSLMPLNLNEDQNYELYSPNQYHSSSSSSSVSSASLSYPILLQVPDQDQHQEISYYSNIELRKPLQNEVAEKKIPSSGSWDDLAAENQQSSSTKRKLRVWKKERDENLQLQEAAEPEIDGGSSVKWMSSKMRVMQKMMVSDQHKFEDQEQPSSPLGTDTSNNNNNNNNNYSNSNHTVRVCSDCHTTKTPLWRSGPRGPKSLCNACGIRQRKARRAMAAAAAAGANGTTVVAAETTVKKNKLQKKKENKSKFEVASSTYMNKKKHKLGVGTKPISDHSQSRKKLCFEDLRLSLINNLALQQIFPQDEKEEAAILLMALSYGLVHG